METRNALGDRTVRQQITARGVGDSNVLRATVEVPRAEFVPPGMVELAYEDAAPPVDEGQTIVQPPVVALIAEVRELGPRADVGVVGEAPAAGSA